MNYEHALDFHVAEFDRQVADLRSILLQKDYDNDQSPEVIRLQKDILKIVAQTFRLKQSHAHAEDLAKRTSP